MLYIIGGKFKKQTLQSPAGEDVRPTSSKLREALFNICQQTIEEAEFLDIFAGSGAVGLEALSRGAKHATFIEKGRHAAKIIKENIEKLKVEPFTEVIVADAFHTLQKFGEAGVQFDIIFADPPYGLGYGEQIIEMVDRYALLKNPIGELFIEDEESPHQLEIPLKRLKLKSKRKEGRCFLSQYILDQATA